MRQAWRSAILVGVAAAVVSLFAFWPRHNPAQHGSRTVLSRTGRWFTVNGKHLYLVGVDLQALTAERTINYAYVLDRLKQYRINKVRIWIYSYFGGPRYLQPWKYSLVWQKFDLDSWNPAFWHRLRKVVAAAEQRSIIVEVSVFDPNNIVSAAQWSNQQSRNAWNKEFNRNGAFSANQHGDLAPEFFELDYPEKSSSGKTLQQYQQALVDKTLQELGSFPNVYFEVANEFPVVFDSSSNAIDRLYPWQLHWAKRIKQESGHLVAAHSHQGAGAQTHGVEYFWDRPYIDILTFHFYSANPAQISSLLHDAQRKGKTLACNESFEVPANLDKATREAWGWFLSGGYYAFYTHLNRVESDQWEPVGQRARALREIAERLPFWKMSPVDESGREYDFLVTQGPTEGRWQVLADPGVAYAVYFWGEHSARSVRMQLPPGDYRFAWYDVRNARTLMTGSVRGSDPVSIATPEKGTWSANVGVALLIRRFQTRAVRPPATTGATVSSPEARMTPRQTEREDTSP